MEKNIFKKLQLTKIEWTAALLTALMLLAAWLIFYYTDYSDTLDNTVLLAESITQGHFGQFYRYSVENASAGTTYTADYHLLVYLIFLVWNLPTVIAHLLTDFDYMTSVKALLWCKALIAAALPASAIVLRKILRLYVKDERKINLASVLFLAGSCTVLPALVLCQYDILAIFFMLLGIYYYIKEDRKRFLLFFAIAVPLKTFALFIFLPLLLLREKNLLRAAAEMLVVFVPQILGELPFRGDPYFQICMDSQNGDAVKLLVESCVQVGKYQLNLFVITYLAVCVICYLVKPKERTEEQQLYIPLYASLAAMSALLLFIDIRGYWIILLVPFLIMAVFWNRKHFTADILLLIGTTTAYSVYSILTFWAFSYRELMTRLILPRFMNFPEWDTLRYGNVQGMFAFYGLDKYANFFYSAFLAGTLLILAVNAPRLERGEEEKPVRTAWPAFLQLALTAGMLVLLLVSRTASCGKAVYDTLGAAASYGEDLYAGNVISQEFEPAEDQEIESVMLKFWHNNGRRYNRSAIRVTITDKDTGEILEEELLAVALIESEQVCRVDFDRKVLRKGHAYLLTLEGIPGAEGQTVEVCPAVTGTPAEGCAAVFINGKAGGGSLAASLQ